MVRPRRFLSATGMVVTWLRRVVSELSSWVSASRSGRSGGRTASAKWARAWASRASVLASLPVALAKSRTWAGIDHHHRQSCCGQGHQRQLQAAGGFQQNSGWSHINQLGNQILGSGLIVGDPPNPAFRTDGNVNVSFGHVDTGEARFPRLHAYLLCSLGLALQDAGLVSPSNRSGSTDDRRGDPRFSTVCYDPGGIGLLHPKPACCGFTPHQYQDTRGSQYSATRDSQGESTISVPR